MKARWILAATAVVLAAVVYQAIDGDDDATKESPTKPRTSNGTRAGMTLSAGGNASSTAVRSPLWQRPAKETQPTLFGEYLRAREYKALYDRLVSSAEGRTSEGRLVLYEILKACTDAARRGSRVGMPPRDQFLTRVAATDPQREQRIAAYDEFSRDRCAGLEGVTATAADLARLLQEAAAGGDPKAKAILLEQELLQARRDSKDGLITLSDANVRTLQEAAASRDPEAIRAAGRVLSTGWSDYGLRLGTDPAPVEPRPFMNAWLVLACEYGANCGADTPRMLAACAMQGYCDAQAYPDYLFHYVSSPHDTERLTQYRQILRNAIETGNWSQVVIVRGPEAGSSRMTFIPGPR